MGTCKSPEVIVFETTVTKSQGCCKINTVPVNGNKKIKMLSLIKDTFIFWLINPLGDMSYQYHDIDHIYGLHMELMSLKLPNHILIN